MAEQFPFENARFFFQGSTCSVDPQGRLVFPKAWKLPTDGEKTEFILSPGLDRCINVYSMEDYNELYRKMKTAPQDSRTQRYLSIYASHCQKITLDKQSRFAVSEKLRKYASLTSKAEFVGGFNYGRIFDPDHWDEIKVSDKTRQELSDEEIAQLSKDDKEMYFIEKAIDFIGTL
jgi:MraZ protein